MGKKTGENWKNWSEEKFLSAKSFPLQNFYMFFLVIANRIAVMVSLKIKCFSWTNFLKGVMTETKVHAENVAHNFDCMQ